MLTYADIQQIYRLERKTPSLQHIADNFYSEAVKLVNETEEKHKAYLKELIDDIYQRRRNKIVLHAIRTSSEDKLPSNIIGPEKELYTRVVELSVEHKNSVLEPEQEIEEPNEERPPESKTVSIRLLQALPAIVGTDSKHYGPFKKDDVIDLPEENAKILIEREIAEEA